VGRAQSESVVRKISPSLGFLNGEAPDATRFLPPNYLEANPLNAARFSPHSAGRHTSDRALLPVSLLFLARRQPLHGTGDRIAAAHGAAGVPPARARRRGGRRRGRSRGAAAAAGPGLRLLPLRPRCCRLPHPRFNRRVLRLPLRRRPRALHPRQQVRVCPLLSLDRALW
jgi:hypothetical protein